MKIKIFEINKSEKEIGSANIDILEFDSVKMKKFMIKDVSEKQGYI